MSQLIDKFYEQQKDNYPNLSLDEFRSICNSPFKFTKEVINQGTLKNVRLQYFGVFEVIPSRIKYSIKTLEEKFKQGKISEEKYNKRKEILNRYESKN